MKHILTADIGGTNSRFGYFQLDGQGALNKIESVWLKTADAESFSDLLSQLPAAGFSLPPDQAEAAVFAVAGPVQRGSYSRPPFIQWEINLAEVSTRFNLGNARLINDFVAQAYACLSPLANDFRLVSPGSAEADAPKAVIGAGTALGQAALLPDGQGGYRPVPSEGGHASFPFESPAEMAFRGFLLSELDRPYVICNDVVSGRGLNLIHRFLTGNNIKPEQLAECDLDGTETNEWMARFFGRACRNYALQVAALGGVFVTGGLAARQPFLVTHPLFMAEFHRSATMGHLLANIPVFINDNQESGLYGAAVAAALEFNGRL